MPVAWLRVLLGAHKIFAWGVAQFGTQFGSTQRVGCKAESGRGLVLLRLQRDGGAQPAFFFPDYRQLLTVV